MSSEQTGDSSQISQSSSPISFGKTAASQQSPPTKEKIVPESQTQTTAATGDETNLESELDKKPAATNPDQPSDITSPSTPDDPRLRPRQVIAVSASKGPAAFFNLARKFLVTDEMCDLSALEGAIVSAADAAHLLERSKLATIVRVQTSYVTVEPKRRRQIPSPPPEQATPQPSTQTGTEAEVSSQVESSIPPGAASRPSTSRELRRARIIITVKRTESYKRWLEENPLQAVIAGDGDEIDDEHSLHAVETESQL